MSTLTATPDSARSVVRLDADFTDVSLPPDGFAVVCTRQDTGAQTLVRTLLAGIPVTAVYQQINANADFEQGIASWSTLVFSGAAPTLAQDTGTGHFNRGSAGMRMTVSATTNRGPGVESEKCPVTPNQVYAVSGWVATGTLGAIPQLGINWYDANNVKIGTTLPGGAQAATPGAAYVLQPTSGQPASTNGYGWIAPGNAATATIVCAFGQLDLFSGTSYNFYYDEMRLLQLVAVVATTTDRTVPAALSRCPAGVGVAYDHEMPLDIPLSYQATSYIVNGTWAIVWPTVTSGAPVVSDTFTRTVSNGWGTPELAPNGAVYTITDSAAVAEHSVASTRAVHQHTTLATTHSNLLSPLGLSDLDLQISLDASTTPTGSDWQQFIDLHQLDPTNLLRVLMARKSGGSVTVEVHRVTGNTDTVVVAAVTVPGGISGNQMTMRIVVRGRQMLVAAWSTSGTKPVDYLIGLVDPLVQGFSGDIRALSVVLTGSTNTLPVSMFFDNLVVAIPQAGGPTSGPVQVASNGLAWLKDPLAPGNSVPITTLRRPYGGWQLNASPQGIGYLGLKGEVRKSMSGQLDVNNRPDPIAQIRQRATPTTSLLLAAHSFADRDALRTLFTPGTQLLLQLPAVYGQQDRYLLFGDEALDLLGSDQRKEIRVFSLPCQVVSAPFGPAQAPVGYRWQDLCRVNLSWGAQMASGGGIYDSYSRAVAAGSLGQPDVAPATVYTIIGTAANFSVPSGAAQVAAPAAATPQVAYLGSYGNILALQVTWTIPVTAAGSFYQIGLAFRIQDASNYYKVVAEYGTANAVTRWYKRLGGVDSLITSSGTYSYAPGQVVRMEIRLTGQTLTSWTWFPLSSARAPDSSPDTVTITDGAPGVLTNAGGVGLLVNRNTGNTNSLTVPFDDLVLVTGPTWQQIGQGAAA